MCAAKLVHGVFALFAHVVVFAASVQLGYGVGHGLGLFGVEVAGEEQVAVAVKLRKLFLG